MELPMQPKLSRLRQSKIYKSLLAVRENASFGRSDDVTILLFRWKIAKNKPKENMALRKARF